MGGKTLISKIIGANVDNDQVRRNRTLMEKRHDVRNMGATFTFQDHLMGMEVHGAIIITFAEKVAFSSGDETMA